ncbi:hypothetical protein [Hyunsoonleella ulvae]|uniref:hypothetical protein n=1 Tax=Hyunsoonleella ulvae TaxID=2799948 RepID=UPI00193994E4|nr:hypothetical protein [Hyunsoonleella ulvae]
MKKSLLLLFFISISTILYSQDVSITKSEIFKDKKKNSRLSFTLESENGGIVTIRSYYGGMMQKLKGYYIQCFDQDLNEIKTLDYEVKNKTIKNAFLKNDKLHLIEIEELKKEKAIAINVSSSNISTLDFSTENLLKFSEENIKEYFGVFLFPFFINNGWGQIDGNHMGEVIFSSNNKFFAINFDIKNKDQETHKVFVFNDEFELVFDKLITKDIKDNLFEYNSFEVDDTDGTVYFLGKSYEKGTKRDKKDGKVNYHFELYKVSATNTENTSFKTTGKLIESLHLLKNNNRLVCTGFFGNDKESKINGVCVYDLDPNSLEINYSKFNNFSDKFLNDKYGNKQNKKKRKKDKGIKNIDFKGVYLMANGDIVINAEEFFISTYTTMNANGGWNTYTVYHFNDIMAVRLDADGNLKWARNINKAQTGFTTSSFTTLPIENSTFFFINCSDNITKLNNGRIAFRQTSSKKSNLYIVSVNEEGNFDYKKLIDDKDSKVYYKVNNGIANLNNQTVFLLGEKKKNGRIVKLKVN